MPALKPLPIVLKGPSLADAAMRFGVAMGTVRQWTLTRGAGHPALGEDDDGFRQIRIVGRRKNAAARWEVVLSDEDVQAIESWMQQPQIEGWILVDDAIKTFRLPRSTLLGWGYTNCVWIGGKVRAATYPGRDSRKVGRDRLFLKLADLMDARAAMRNAKFPPTECTAEEFATIVRESERRVRSWLGRNYCPDLRRGLEAEKIEANDSPRGRWRIKRAEADNLIAARKVWKPLKWLSSKLGCVRRRVEKWIRDGRCPYLNEPFPKEKLLLFSDGGRPGFRLRADLSREIILAITEGTSRRRVRKPADLDRGLSDARRRSLRAVAGSLKRDWARFSERAAKTIGNQWRQQEAEPAAAKAVESSGHKPATQADPKPAKPKRGRGRPAGTGRTRDSIRAVIREMLESEPEASTKRILAVYRERHRVEIHARKLPRLSEKDVRDEKWKLDLKAPK